MMKLYKLTKLLANIYLILFFIVWSIGIFGIFIKEGLGGVINILSPFNFVNLIVTLVLISPGLLLYALANKIKEKALNRESQTTIGESLADSLNKNVHKNTQESWGTNFAEALSKGVLESQKAKRDQNFLKALAKAKPSQMPTKAIRGKTQTPLKELADQMVKGMVHNLNTHAGHDNSNEEEYIEKQSNKTVRTESQNSSEDRLFLEALKKGVSQKTSKTIPKE